MTHNPSARPKGGYQNDAVRLVLDYPDFVIAADVRVSPTTYTARLKDGGSNAEVLEADTRDQLAGKMDAARRGGR